MKHQLANPGVESYLRPGRLSILDYQPWLADDNVALDEQKVLASTFSALVDTLRHHYHGFSLSVLLLDETADSSAEMLHSLVAAGVGGHDRLTILRHAPAQKATPQRLAEAVLAAEFAVSPRVRTPGTANRGLALEHFDVVLCGCESEPELFAAKTYGVDASLYLVNADGQFATPMVHNALRPHQPVFAAHNHTQQSDPALRPAMPIAAGENEAATERLLGAVSACTADTGHALDYECDNQRCPRPEIAQLILRLITRD